MEKTKYIKSVLKGSVGAIILCIIGVVILSALMTKFSFDQKIYNVIYVVISLIGLSIGSIIGAKKNESKGWLVGFGVASGYYFILYVGVGILSGSWSFTMMECVKYIICTAVGILSGMLGVNI